MSKLSFKHVKYLLNSIPDELQSSEKETAMSECINASNLSPLNEKTEALQNPQREVLSPIHSNIERSHSISSDAKTPKLRAVPFDRENNIHEYGTPLDKITARSSNMKVLFHLLFFSSQDSVSCDHRCNECFVQTSLLNDYIEFLNTASR